MATFTEEATNEVYDRQIRLWGADAQRKIQSTKILFLGLGATSVELAKNLVLAGFGATLASDASVQARDQAYNFFVREEDVGANVAEASLARVAELNPFATVDALAKGLDAASDDAAAAALVKGYGVVVVDAPYDAGSDEARARVDAACRAAGATFVAVRCTGEGAVAFLDLGEKHTYVVEKGEGASKTTSDPMEKRYCSYDAARVAKWDTVKTKKMPAPPAPYLLDRLDALWAERTPRSPPHTGKKRKAGKEPADPFLEWAPCELRERGLPPFPEGALERHVRTRDAPLAPVAAVVAGVLGSEVVKAVSGKGEPTNNVFVFDAATGEGSCLLASPDAPAEAKPPAPPPEDAIEL